MSWNSFAIVPAAGRSLRMGRPKLLLPWGSGTIIEQVLAAWRGSRVDATVVIVHPDDDELAEVCRRVGAEVVVADEPPPDMKASISIGLAHIAARWHPSATDAWLAGPADLPLLESRTIDALLSAYDPAKPEIAVPVTPQRKRSHPVLYPWSLAAKVAQLPHDRGINDLLIGSPVREVTMPWLVASADVDTPDDYHRLHDRYHRPLPPSTD